jgi:hypothetical protein
MSKKKTIQQQPKVLGVSDLYEGQVLFENDYIKIVVTELQISYRFCLYESDRPEIIAQVTTYQK